MSYNKALLAVARAVTSEQIKSTVGIARITVDNEPATFRATESGHGFGVMLNNSEMHYFSYSELDSAVASLAQ